MLVKAQMSTCPDFPKVVARAERLSVRRPARARCGVGALCLSCGRFCFGIALTVGSPLRSVLNTRQPSCLAASIKQLTLSGQSVEVARLAKLDRHFEQISPDNDVAIIDTMHFMDHAFQNTGFVEGCRHVRDNERFGAGSLSDFGNVKVPAICPSECFVRFGADHEMTHVNEHVTVCCKLDHALKHAATIARIDNDTGIAFKAVCKTLKIGLEMDGLADRRLPTVALNRLADNDFFDLGERPDARHHTAAGLIDVQTRLLICPCGEVEVVDAARCKQLVGQSGDRCRPKHGQFRFVAGGMIPALQHKAGIIDDVVEMQVRKEGMRDVHRVSPGFEEAMCCSGSMIEHNHIIADLKQVPGTYAFD